MVSLRDTKLKTAYSSQDSDVLHEFYIPVLSASKEYYRITGFFSSDSFAVAAKGVSELIKSNGKIKLITGFFIKNEDISAAEQALMYPDLIMREVDKLLSEYEKIESLFIRESIKAFAWMLANNLLEIKVAFPKREAGKEYSAIFHQKVGIVKDADGNALSFSGSINETGAGWLNNIEEFKVFRAWDPSEKEYFNSDYEHFFKLWDNKYDKVQVIPLDEAIKTKIVNLAPEDQDHINFDVLEGNVETKKVGTKIIQKAELNLRDYQNKALNAWTTSNFCGIVEMATGTGKTRVGLKVLNTYLDKEKSGIVTILAPTMEICDQWIADVEEYGNYDDFLLISSKENWRKNIENLLHEHSKGRLKRLVLVSTYDSFTNLLAFLKGYKITNALVIADEVHSFGSNTGKDILKDESASNLFKYRLGLSATPERLFDISGTDAIKAFFGNIVFRYTIGDAIRDNVLCPYNYHIQLTELSQVEFADYIKLTKKLNKKYHYAKSKEDEEYLRLLLTERARITKSSENKIDKVKEVLSTLNHERRLKYTLVFCTDKNQLDDVKDILDETKIVHSQITGHENRYERFTILKDFRNGDIDVLLSIKVLDEGINIKEAKNAIILASSANPREYIQRRGRVLRKTDANKTAEIFDFVTVASLSVVNRETDVFNIEQNLIKKELSRAFEFVKYSNNKKDIFKNEGLEKLIRFYNISDIYNLLK